MVTDVISGSLALKADGGFIYTPTLNISGIDHFTYKLSDGKLESGLATVTITLQAVNDPPVAVKDTASTNEDYPVISPSSR